MLNVPLNITLHDNQRLIMNSKSINVVTKAGKRFGKSKVACYKMIKEAGAMPGGNFWYVAPYFSHCKDIIWHEFKEMIPHKLIKRIIENELLIELYQGATISLRGADNEVRLRGRKIHGLVCDEAAYFRGREVVNLLLGQLLDIGGKKRGFAWFISSPARTGSNWYSDFYQETLRKKLAGDTDHDAFKFTIFDNPLLARGDIEKIREGCTADEWQTEYLAEESAHAGKVYSEFDFSRHVGLEEPNKYSTLVRAIDWGINHSTVCLFVRLDQANKKLFIDDEYCQSGYTIEESCNVINRKTNSQEVAWTVCDPSMNKRNSQTKRTDKQEFDRLGIFCVGGDNNYRGYNITKMFFKKNMIRINPKCKNLITQLRTLEWSGTDGKPEDKNDDCTDALRYACVRIHDLMFKWKDEQSVQQEPQSPFGHKSFNLNDRNLFPKAAMNYSNSIMQEINTY